MHLIECHPPGQTLYTGGNRLTNQADQDNGKQADHEGPQGRHITQVFSLLGFPGSPW